MFDLVRRPLEASVIRTTALAPRSRRLAAGLAATALLVPAAPAAAKPFVAKRTAHGKVSFKGGQLARPAGRKVR